MRLSKSMMGRSVVLWCMAGALQSHRKDTKVSWIRRSATSLTQSGTGYCHRLLRLLHSCRADSSNLPTNAIRMGITAPAPHRNSLRGRFLPRFREGARFLRVYERQSRGSAWLGERGGSCQLGSVLAYPKGRSDHRGGRARSRVRPHAHLPIRFRCPCPAIIKDFRGAAGETSQSDEIHTDHTRPWRGELARPFEDYSRVVGSGNQRGPTGTSTARGVRFFPLTVYANGSVPPYDQTHPLPSFTRQPLNSVQPISPSSSPSTSPPRSSRDYSRSARLKVANTVARTFVFWASIRRRTLGRDGSSLGRGRSVGWRIGRRPLGSAGMVLKGVGEKW